MVKKAKIFCYDLVYTHASFYSYQTAIEASMRMYARPVVTLSHSVAKLWVHTPSSANIVIEEGEEEEALPRAQAAVEGQRRTKLTQFLAKCAAPETRNEIVREGYVDGPLANELLYDDFPCYYTWVTTGKYWKRRKRTDGAEQFVARMGSVNPRNEELTALRILLQHTPGKMNKGRKEKYS